MNVRFLVFFLLISPSAYAQHTSVQYLANEGVMVAHEETKVLFDPLFNNSYGQYQLVPTAMRAAIFAGERPYDDVDAVFVSHHHGDHFDPEDMLRLLREQPGIHLYAPAQAVTAIRQIAGDEDAAVLDRMTGLDLDYGDEPVSIQAEDLVVDAVHIPHTGWPTARTDVQNIAFRVTLGDANTVVHLGDADARVVHYESDEDYWEERTIDLALPPYWYFGSSDGIEILENRLNVNHAIGIHVPDSFSSPANIPAELAGRDLFTRPGEGRRF
jgi:L-ascorbate metabolism protein UlaG (beta-lactamase superfamily)